MQRTLSFGPSRFSKGNGNTLGGLNVAKFPFPDANLVVAYNLDNLSDSFAGNTLTNNGGVAFVPGKIGSAAQFDANEKNLRSTSFTFPTGDFTLSLWLNPTSYLGSQNQFVASSGVNGGPYGALIFLFGSNNNSLYFLAQGTNTLQLGPYTVTTAAWQHILMRRSGSTLTAWVNGVQVGSGSSTGALNHGGNTGITIGASPTGSPSRCLVDALAVWSRALTDTEIATIYNSGEGAEY